ncbi:MAG: GIY-YIG nuclease family protein [bacterium]|nr:GIY-YIG nuclease family protein [bacterium]
MSSPFVYIAGAWSAPGVLYAIKIGISSDPGIRVKSLQTGCPMRLFLMTFLPVPIDQAPAEYEAKLHSTFKKDRIIGEWFRPSKPVLQWVLWNMEHADAS